MSILVKELQKNYHFDLGEPSMLLVKNPGTGNPLEKVVRGASAEIMATLEEAIREASSSSNTYDYETYD